MLQCFMLLIGNNILIIYLMRNDVDLHFHGGRRELLKDSPESGPDMVLLIEMTVSHPRLIPFIKIVAQN